jgi:Recombination endonuclease VII
MSATKPTCSLNDTHGCNKAAYAKGLCRNHHAQGLRKRPYTRIDMEYKTANPDQCGVVARRGPCVKSHPHLGQHRAAVDIKPKKVSRWLGLDRSAFNVAINHSLSADQFIRLRGLHTQDGIIRCALCGGEESNFRRRLAVDHDHHCPDKSKHKKGKRGEVGGCAQCIRGLLCDRCNRIFLPIVEAFIVRIGVAHITQYLAGRPLAPGEDFSPATVKFH